MATKTLDVRTQISRDTSAHWTKYDPVLLDGEIVIVDTAEGEVRYKVGNGTKKYIQLPFDDEAVKTLINGKMANDAVEYYTGTNPALAASSGVCTWSVSHILGKKVAFNIIVVASGEEIMATTLVPNDNSITVKLASTAAIAAGKYRITVIGCEVSA